MFHLPRRTLFLILRSYWLLGCLHVTSTKSHNNEIHNWQTGPWGTCWSKDGCGPGVEERTVWCGDSLARPVPKYICRPDELPSHTRPCFSACQGIWKVGSWSECHFESGTRLKQDDGLCLGTRERNVSCYSMINDVAPKCSDALPPSKVSCYTLCPQDCIVGPWTQWTPCTDECDERKYRTRQVIVPPAHGGSQCPYLSQSKLCTKKCHSADAGNNEVVYPEAILVHHQEGLSSFSPSSLIKKLSTSSIKNVFSKPEQKTRPKLRVGEWQKCTQPTDAITPKKSNSIKSILQPDDTSFESRLEWEIRDAISILKSETTSKDDEMDPRESLSPAQIERLNSLRYAYPQVGVQERNVTCVGVGGKLFPVSDCSTPERILEGLTERSCIIELDCRITQWAQWRTIVEGCVAPNGQVVKEIRERRRVALSLHKGKGTPCPHLLERHTVPEPSLQPCNTKYHWLASTWGPCLSTVGPDPETRVTCGGGIQNRQITCVRVENHIPVEDQSCLHVEPPPRYQRCEVGCERDCAVGPWSAWGVCTPNRCKSQPTLNMPGYRRRIREVVVSASAGGNECPPIEEQAECYNAQCHQWLIGDWSECILDSKSKSCGKGHIARNVTCVDEMGAPSPKDECIVELGSISTEEGCQVPCSYDCVVAPWSVWSPCSKPCADLKAVGYTHRNTSILAPNGSGGRECPAPDELTQVKTCREEPCSGSAWIPGEWGTCLMGTVDSCGQGVQIRPILCIDQSNKLSIESYKCAGLLEPRQEKSCEISCGSKCSLTSWSEWSQCLVPKNCPQENRVVTSQQTRWRRILLPPSAGNPSCGPTEEERTCAFHPGTCKASKWNPSGWSQCALSPGIECGTGYRVRAVNCVNGSDDITNPTECLMGNRIIPESSEECFVHCEKPCIVSSWSPWSSCSPEEGCTKAKSVRTRLLIDNSEKHNKCRMISLKETEDCPCSTYYSETGSDWSECLLGPLIDEVRNYFNEDNSNGVAELVTKTEDFDYKEENMMSRSGDDEDSCGVGTKYRSLKCRRNDKVLADPDSCGHNGIEWEPCMVECPSDCLVAHWEEWTSCNATCGAGLQYRNRKIVQLSLWDGRKCPSIREERACWGNCRTRWIAEGWNECHISFTNECGTGFQNRTIRCIRLLSSGMEVTVEDSHCDFHQRPMRDMICKIYCPGECVVSDWSDWSNCPRGCQNNTERTRSRKVIRHPSKNSSGCPHLVEREPCIKGVSCWTYSWRANNWTHCVPLGKSSCGEGVKNRPISCYRSGGTIVKEYYCSRETRPAPQEKWCYVDCPIDCQVTPWTHWDDSKCSCGDKPGEMKRKRFILVNPSDSGKSCPKNVQETLPCPGIPCYTWERSRWSECKLMGGNCGHGAMERTVLCLGPGGIEVDDEKCLALVHVGGHTWPYLAHALDLNTMDGCYVPCEGDCELTEWSPWSHCHRDCTRGQQGGSRTRSRAILSTGATTPCPGPLWENKPCVAGPCLTFTWQIIHGSVACVRSDGLVVTGGCGDVPRPCVPDCRVRNSMCSPVGVCVCRPGLRPHYSESMRYRITKCIPTFNVSLTEALPLSQSKYLPEGINGWMFAMVTVGGAFVIFVIISIYLLSKSPREEAAIPLTMRRQQNSATQSS